MAIISHSCRPLGHLCLGQIYSLIPWLCLCYYHYQSSFSEDDRVWQSPTCSVPAPHMIDLPLPHWRSESLGIFILLLLGSFYISPQAPSLSKYVVEICGLPWENHITQTKPLYWLGLCLHNTVFILSYSSFRCWLSADSAPVMHWVWPKEIISLFNVSVHHSSCFNDVASLVVHIYTPLND